MSSDTKHTSLYELHLELGGKLVPFAGYSLPVQYPDGIIKEHLHTRQQAGLFDVSHMGQIVVKGSGCDRLLEQLVPVDLEASAVGRQTYAVLTNAEGGILDDLIIARWSDDSLFLVVNAACKEQDLAHLQAHLNAAGADIEITPQFDRALLALQGPAAAQVMAQLAPEAAALTFMSGCHTQIENVPCHISRSGYTGEDGFEISLAADDADTIARRLLAFEQVAAIGLGARDSLRLEAGLCLYGHDMTEQTSPIEASLQWSISKSRRAGGAKAGGFPGADRILEQMETGVSRRRVGVLVEGRAPVREGAELVNQDGVSVGVITSGGFSPCLQQPIAMGYVEQSYAAVATPLQAMVRGAPKPVTVAKLPFVKQNYFRG